ASQSFATSGFRNVAVSADGNTVYATAPNEHQDDTSSNHATFSKLPGNLVRFDMTPTATGGDPKVNFVVGGKETYAVTTTPGRKDAAFTNAEDVGGVYVTIAAAQLKQTIPLDLDKLATARNSQLSVHNT